MQCASASGNGSCLRSRGRIFPIRTAALRFLRPVDGASVARRIPIAAACAAIRDGPPKSCPPPVRNPPPRPRRSGISSAAANDSNGMHCLARPRRNADMHGFTTRSRARSRAVSGVAVRYCAAPMLSGFRGATNTTRSFSPGKNFTLECVSGCIFFLTFAAEQQHHMNHPLRFSESAKFGCLGRTHHKERNLQAAAPKKRRAPATKKKK